MVTTDVNEALALKADANQLTSYTLNTTFNNAVNELDTDIGTLSTSVINTVAAIGASLDSKAALNDPLFNLTNLGNGKTLNDIVNAYSPPVDLSTVVSKPSDFGEIGAGDLTSYIRTVGFKLWSVL